MKVMESEECKAGPIPTGKMYGALLDAKNDEKEI
jgi:hypothetical protein